MEGAVWGFIGVLAGAALGATASIATTVITSRNASRLQSEADSLQRRERARAFQRDNLLQLQDALHDSLRLIVRAHLEDQAASRKGGNWGKTRLSEDVNEGIMLANRRMNILVERVADDSLRSELKCFCGMLIHPFLAPSAEEANSHMQEVAKAAEGILEHIGVILRANYQMNGSI